MLSPGEGAGFRGVIIQIADFHLTLPSFPLSLSSIPGAWRLDLILIIFSRRKLLVFYRGTVTWLWMRQQHLETLWLSTDFNKPCFPNCTSPPPSIVFGLSGLGLYIGMSFTNTYLGNSSLPPCHVPLLHYLSACQKICWNPFVHATFLFRFYEI